jgi:sulfane dehydrogenase subunit SoxC
MRRRDFIRGAAVAGAGGLLLNERARAANLPTPEPRPQDLPPQPEQTEVGWTGGLVAYAEVRNAFRDHGFHLEQLDEDVTPLGDHYQLHHFDIPRLDADGYSIAVSGAVKHPMRISLADLQKRENVKQITLLECAGNGRAWLNPRPVYVPWFQESIGAFEYVGTPLAPILRDAGVQADAVDVVFRGHDRGVSRLDFHEYAQSVPVDKALEDGVILSWEANGESLPPAHGFPLRVLVPGWYGTHSTKWLKEIEVLDRPFAGYERLRAYRYTQHDPAVDPGQPVTAIRVRAAMKPPGVTDTGTMSRWVEPGPQTVVGKAWSGSGRIATVEFSADDGRTWTQAKLGRPVSPYSWTPWAVQWSPSEGDYVLSCRATDASGNAQPLDAQTQWNYLGMGNNCVEKWRAVVRSGMVLSA